MPTRLFCWLLFAAILLGQSASEPKPIAWGVAERNLIEHAPAKYPALAQEARISGTVILRLVISESGSVTNVKVVRGHPLLVNAAVQAVRQWRFTPFAEDGHQIPVVTRAQVRFSARSSAEQERLEDQLFVASDACGVAYQDKQLDEAMHWCKAALQILSDLPDTQAGERMDLFDEYGQVLLARDQKPEAIAQFKNEVAVVKSLSLCEFPDCGFAHEHLATALKADGQTSAAIREYESAEKIFAKLVKSRAPGVATHSYAETLKGIYSNEAALLKQEGNIAAAAKVEDKAAALP